MFFVLRLFGSIVSFAVTVWLLATAALFAIMWLPPQQFAGVIGKLPTPMFMAVLPFQPLWMIARGGSLSKGDLAPDFDLAEHKGEGRVRLSQFHGERPVVLVFGSYT